MLVIQLTDTGRVLYTYCDTSSLLHLIDTAVSFILSSPWKTYELDAFPTPLLLNIECLDSLLPCITAVFNNSLVSGVFPFIYKSTLVKSLLKKMFLDPDDLKNHRPVSNFSFFFLLSKVLENIFLSQLNEHLNHNNFLSKHAVNHHAFADDNQLYKISTLDAIHQSIETLQNCTTDVKTWMTANKLQVNDNKTEAMIILECLSTVLCRLSFTSETPMSHLCRLLRTSVQPWTRISACLNTEATRVKQHTYKSGI